MFGILQVDISVDTFPYAGTTTTCEALYCGVPVVSLQRTKFPNHAHNVGATLLTRIKGMSRFVASTEDDYIRLAVATASDIPKLIELRKTLRPTMLASTLCDGEWNLSRSDLTRAATHLTGVMYA